MKSGSPKHLHTYSLGFLRRARVRRILDLAGYRVTTGWPRATGWVGVWGQRPVSARGRWVAARSGARLLTIEDGFLHSVGSGTDAPISLILDDLGIYFDGRSPSRLERILEFGHDYDTNEAKRLLDLLKSNGLSKYTPAVPRETIKEPHVLIVDQTAGDASIAGAMADASTFQRMLEAARTENPGAQLVIKTHPEVAAGRKRGHFTADMLREDERLCADPINPWDLLEAASAVYTVSSQLGYEAVLAGRRVRCFGAAFFAGWGLTEDEHPLPRRTRRFDLTDLFAGCHLAYPIYYDPWRDRLCGLDTACEALSCQLAARTRDDGTQGDIYAGVRSWKRPVFRRFRPITAAPRFADSLEDAARIARTEHRHLWLWASRHPTESIGKLARDGAKTGMVEDGFLRSVGLGAELTQAASLVFDRQGIYFDPNHASDLEDWVTRAAAGEADLARAAALRKAITAGGVTKYNLRSGAVPSHPADKQVILVPGQVEDDASIQRGCGEMRTNLALLRQARAANPNAWLVYKPHPDVEAGLRQGHVPQDQAAELADAIALHAPAAELLDQADAVWTLTSLMGFEALLRGKPVTCLGTPFYAGWGLTQDLGPSCPRRTARPSLDALVWAALIAYPSYIDPVSGLPCAPELVVERLAEGKPGRKAGLLSKLQGLFAAQSWLWRR